MSGSIVPPGVAGVIEQLQNLVRATWAEANNIAAFTAAVSAVSHGFAITPSNTTVFDPPTRSIWVGGIGNLVVLLAGDTVPVTFTNVPADTMLPLAVSKVMAATTATLIVVTLLTEAVMAMGFAADVPTHARNIYPDDTVAFDPPLRYLWIGGPPMAIAASDEPGTEAKPPDPILTIVLAAEGQTPVQLRGIQPGTMLQLGIVAVNDSTNVTQIIGFW